MANNRSEAVKKSTAGLLPLLLGRRGLGRGGRLYRNLSVTILALVGAALVDGSEAEQHTYAERLGWGPKARVVMFHCDDAGMSHASNLGAIESLEKGVVTSVSIMMPCPWVPEFVNYLKEHPQLDAGLHLTLNSEWTPYRWGPLAGKPAVPGLCDPDGYLWHSTQDTARHATADEVEREIRAQIDKAEA